MKMKIIHLQKNIYIVVMKARYPLGLVRALSGSIQVKVKQLGFLVSAESEQDN